MNGSPETSGDHRLAHKDPDTPRLVAVASTLRDAQEVVGKLAHTHPRVADRLEVAEDPLLGLSSRVVQLPDSLDTDGGLPVLYLGGTISQHNWQARAVAVLRSEQVVIVNPRHERTGHPADQEQQLFRLAWRHRHVMRADIVLFWFEGPSADPMTFLEFGTQFADPLPVEVGTSPDFPYRALLRDHLGHIAPHLTVHSSIEATAAAVARRLRHPIARLRVLPLPHDPSTSAFNLTIAISRLKPQPGLRMLLRELVIEAGCAAGHGIEPDLLATVYMCADRLHHDPEDPLAWAELSHVRTALKSGWNLPGLT